MITSTRNTASRWILQYGRVSWQKQKSQGSRASERRYSIITITINLPTINEWNTVKLSLSSASRTHVGTLYLLTLKFTWQLKYYPNAESSHKQQRACLTTSIWNHGRWWRFELFLFLLYAVSIWWRILGSRAITVLLFNSYIFMERLSESHFPNWHLTVIHWLLKCTAIHRPD